MVEAENERRDCARPMVPVLHDELEEEDDRIEEQFFGIKEGGILWWDVDGV